ncbi:beta-galactosidase [Granulicella sp. WH15]|uniref:beta-galactosidase n=1 Tax=Granulicella sp. WH15 TaxID=2602070 RepID=UPI0013669E23|nr:beta-galactosidase [Granulicella sp. WH15]QHN02994.1 beta-galactosidase [Granulicella sp. WH15]
MTPNAPLLGSAWYPEQWPESRWDADLALMEQAHMNVVRIGEFAWSTLEPSEGRYDLDWLDRAITLAGKHHLAVVLGTPTDAPPAWLTTKYPDTLGMNADGHYREHGGRRQFNYASLRYRQLCALIVRQMAQRFGHNPNIIGWQIGNEYTDESFDTATRAQFQHFLQAKYKTLDNLNRQWTTAYWSQTYTAWDQIPMVNTNGNPGLLLEHKHFVTATWRSFQKEQVDVLRAAILPSQFITTNIGGLAWSDNWDHYEMTEDLDLASWDDYVGQGHLQPARNAMLNDFVRGWKRQNFWVMETQPGSVNWAPINNALAPGETRALAWQTIGHGADAVLYWQWRDALNGQEQYHGAIAGPDGKPLPIYDEIEQLGRDLDLTRSALAGTSPHAEVAVLHDYDSRWAIDFQLHTREYDQQQVLVRFYAQLQELVRSVDVIRPITNLDGYKLLVAPSLNVIPQTLADHLMAWVQAGGHLLLGPRSGMKDEYNSLHPQRQPGPLAAALGGRVEQYYALTEPVRIGKDATTDIWAEQLSTTAADTTVDLRYGVANGWLDGRPAMITRAVGRGSISYLGALPDEASMRSLMSTAVHDAHVAASSASLPKDVELCIRSNAERTIAILINHSNAAQQAVLTGRYRSLLPAVSTRPGANTTTVELPMQGVAVLEVSR